MLAGSEWKYSALRVLVWLNIVLLQLVPHCADNHGHNSSEAGFGVVVRRGGLTVQVGGLHRKALTEQFRAANLLFLRKQGHVFGKGAVHKGVEGSVDSFFVRAVKIIAGCRLPVWRR